MSAGQLPGAELGEKLAKAFSGKGVHLSSNAVSVEHHDCEDCRWQQREYEWDLCQVNVFGFSRWLAARIVVLVSFEFDGCNVHNARCRISSKTLNRWYNDSAKYEIRANGAESKLTGPTGCEKCCSKSSCVEFDVELSRSWDWVRTAVDSWRVRICGDGSVTIE